MGNTRMHISGRSLLKMSWEESVDGNRVVTIIDSPELKYGF